MLFKEQIKTSLFYHLLIYLIGVAGLWIFYFQTSRQFSRRAAVEERLSVQEQHLRGIVDNISNGIAVYETEDGENFRLKRINPAGLRIAHIESDGDMAGVAALKRYFPVLPRPDWPRCSGGWPCSGEPENLSVSACIHGKRGEEESVLPCLEYYVYKLPTGEIVAVYEDVTSRKKAREQLIRKTEEWESTFDAIPDIITLQDKEMRIIRANQATFEFFHLPPDKLIGKTCHSLFRSAALRRLSRTAGNAGSSKTLRRHRA